MGARVNRTVMSGARLSLTGCVVAGLLAACASMPSVQDMQQRQAAYVAASELVAKQQQQQKQFG